MKFDGHNEDYDNTILAHNTGQEDEEEENEYYYEEINGIERDREFKEE